MMKTIQTCDKNGGKRIHETETKKGGKNEEMSWGGGGGGGGGGAIKKETA